MDIRSEIPKILGYYDFGISPVILAGEGTDPNLARATSIHEQTHKDDIFNTIYGRILRECHKRIIENEASDTDRAAFNLLIDRAWNVFEGSATVCQTIQELCAPDGRSYNAIVDSFPENYKQALAVYKRVMWNTFDVESKLLSIFDTLLFQILCRQALTEVILDVPLQYGTSLIKSFDDLKFVYLGHQSADAILLEIARRPRHLLEIPLPDITPDILLSGGGLRRQREYVERIKPSLMQHLFGPGRQTFSDQQMLDFAAEIGINNRTAESDEPLPVQDVSYELRYENPRGTVDYTKRSPVIAFTELVEILTGLPGYVVSVSSLVTGEDGVWIASNLFDMRSEVIKNGDGFEAPISRLEMAQLVGILGKNAWIIVPPDVVMSGFVDIATMKSSQAEWMVTVGNFHPDLLPSVLNFISNGQPPTIMTHRFASSIELVALRSHPICIVFPCLPGDIDRYVERLGVVPSGPMTTFELLGLSVAQALMGQDSNSN